MAPQSGRIGASWRPAAVAAGTAEWESTTARRVPRPSLQLAERIAAPEPAARPSPPHARLRLAGSIASAAALALLPKCPVCLAAYLSAFGLGAGAASLAGILYPITGIAAAVITCLLGVRLAQRARRSRRIAPALAVAAALATVAIACLADAPLALRLTGLAALALALVWNCDASVRRASGRVRTTVA